MVYAIALVIPSDFEFLKIIKYQDIVEYSFLTELISENSPVIYEEIRIDDYVILDDVSAHKSESYSLHLSFIGEESHSLYSEYDESKKNNLVRIK